MTILTTVLLYIFVALVVAFLFGLVVFVHELGHFLVARLLGFHATTFAIGFGPALWKRTIGGTEYRVNALPLGGYVALPQLDPSGMEHLQGEHGEGDTVTKEPLPDMPPWKRILVSLAGPFGNILLAVIAAWAIYLFAPPGSTGAFDTKIGYVDQDSDAWQAGLRPGQTILRVNDKPIKNWNDFILETHLTVNPGGVPVTIADPGSTNRTLTVATTQMDNLHLVAGVAPQDTSFIGGVETNSPAALAGLLPGDQLLTLNGEPIHSSVAFSKNIIDNGDTPVILTILRGRDPVTVSLSPAYDETLQRHRIGIIFRPDVRPQGWMQYHDPWQQLSYDAGLVFRTLRPLVAPKAPGETGRVAKSIGGPLALLYMLWHSVLAGVWSCLGLVRMICINLAIINLLPLPVLDGGHIVFALWEMITRKKVHPRVLTILVNVFAVLLIGLMLLLTGRDSWSFFLKKLFTPKSIPAPVEQLQENDE